MFTASATLLLTDSHNNLVPGSVASWNVPAQVPTISSSNLWKVANLICKGKGSRQDAG